MGAPSSKGCWSGIIARALEERLAKIEMRQEATIPAINALMYATVTGNKLLRQLPEMANKPPKNDLSDTLRGLILATMEAVSLQLKNLPQHVAEAVLRLPRPHSGSSWGSSLANLLTKPSWDAVRFPLIRARDNTCQLCEVRHGSMECHDIWAYLHAAGRPARRDGRRPKAG